MVSDSGREKANEKEREKEELPKHQEEDRLAPLQSRRLKPTVEPKSHAMGPSSASSSNGGEKDVVRTGRASIRSRYGKSLQRRNKKNSAPSIKSPPPPPQVKFKPRGGWAAKFNSAQGSGNSTRLEKPGPTLQTEDRGSVSPIGAAPAARSDDPVGGSAKPQTKTEEKKKRADGKVPAGPKIHSHGKNRSMQSPSATTDVSRNSIRSGDEIELMMAVPTYLSRDDRAQKPGAFRVQGIDGDDAEDFLSSSANNDSVPLVVAGGENEEVVPELPAVLVAGVTQDNLELQRLRQKLANAVKAQVIVDVEDAASHGNSGQQVVSTTTTGTSASSTPNQQQRVWNKCGGYFAFVALGIFLLAASAVAVAIPFMLRGTKKTDPPSVAPATPAPSWDDSPMPTTTTSTLFPVDAPTTQLKPPTPVILAPTMMPNPLVVGLTQKPTRDECLLDVEMPCNVTISNLEKGTMQNMSCLEAMSSDMGKLCDSTPFRAWFLYNGGGCGHQVNESSPSSSSSGMVDYSCIDSEVGAPPSEEGVQSYIIVTDSPARGYRAHIYFRGFVRTGDFFPIESPGGTLLDTGIRIVIFASDDIGDPANTVLQEIQYNEVLCSSSAELTNHFGALQLSSYENEDQGHVLSSISTDIDTTMSIIVRPLYSGSEVVSMSKLTASASSGLFGRIDFTDQVAGTLVQPGGFLSVQVPLELDLSDLRRGRSYWADATGMEADSGKACTGSWPVRPPATDSGPPPSQAAPPYPRPPPISVPYVPNPFLTACKTKAIITCEYGNPNGGRILGDCMNIVDPRTLSCSDDLPATGLAFRYLGGSGLPDTVLIDASSSDVGSDAIFSAPVRVGDLFRFGGDFRGQVVITISSLQSDNTAGEAIESHLVNTACERSNTAELTLTSTFGPLELIGFENLFGYFTSILDVHLQYFVSNVGFHSMVTESARVSGDLLTPAPFEVVTSELVVNGTARILVYEESITVDVGEKFAQNDTFVFALDVRGRGELSNLDCFGRAGYVF